MDGVASWFPLITAAVALIGASLMGGGLGHTLWRRRRRGAAWDALRRQGKRGPGGLELETLQDGPLHHLTLICPHAPAKGCALVLDTASDAVVPERLEPFALGQPELDRAFRVRGGTTSAIAGLQTTNLSHAGRFLRAWRARLQRVSVSTTRVRFTVEQHQLAALPQALPQLVHFASSMMAAVRWCSPGQLVRGEAGAFRGSGHVAPDAPVWQLERAGAPPGSPQRVGPLSLHRLLELMRRGQINWLTRAASGEQGPLRPLWTHPELQGVRCELGDRQPEPPRASPGSSSGRSLLPLAQRYSVATAAWLVLLVATLLTGANLRRSVVGQQSRNWPRTPGTVVSSRLITGRDSDDGARYRPGLSYRYAVDGIGYTGHRLSFAHRGRYAGYDYDRQRVERILARYPVGQTVQVAYAPHAPERSVLQPGQVSGERTAALMGLGVMTSAALLLLLLAAGRLQAWQLRRRSAQDLEAGLLAA